MSKSDDLELTPQLIEVPSQTTQALNGVGPNEFISLLTDESVGTLVAKVGLLEAFLNLVTKDCNFNDFVREILIFFMNLVKSEAGSILEADHEYKQLSFRSVVGSRSDKVTNFVIPFGQGIVGHVAESRATLLVDNVTENKVHLKSIEKAIGFETRNLVCVPILIRGRVYGVLELLNRIGEENFTPEDVDLLNYACKMAAKAIEVRLMVNWTKKNDKGGEQV